ncbi:hypothetical protein JL101_008760 [Skermanella rosea]|uniref:hypothetical protein n=1 Tax=Skermanella rosea TaxID=1817965 RepID=UPI001933AACB|nr:hypothetical protein [Skermanella rosea]UEM05509.1 hypothetical protein JL101_008760 [Skermanella rosea]
MVILSLCGDKYNHPSEKLEDLTPLDRAWKRVMARIRHFGQHRADAPAVSAPPRTARTAA